MESTFNYLDDKYQIIREISKKNMIIWYLIGEYFLVIKIRLWIENIPLNKLTHKCRLKRKEIIFN